MKLTNCENCGIEVNIELKDAWVCNECDALHQTTMRNLTIDGNQYNVVEVVVMENNELIINYFNIFMC